MNLGLQDAAALAATLHEGVACGHAVGSIHSLKDYEGRRATDNAAMILGADVVKRLFDDSHSVTPLSLLRSLGMACINAVDPLKALVTAQAKGDRSLSFPSRLW